MKYQEIQKFFLDNVLQNFKECYEPIKNRKIVLFGAGSYGAMMIRAFDDIGIKSNIVAVCDNDSGKWGGFLESLPICNIADIVWQEKDFLVIISSQYEKEIITSLQGYNIEIFKKPPYQYFIEEMMAFYLYKTAVINDRLDVYKWIEEYAGHFAGKETEVIKLLEDQTSRDIAMLRTKFYQTGDLKYIMSMPVDTNQYFNKFYYNHIDESEVFVDCGAYTGDSISGFIKCVNNTYKKIYAFEPDKKNYKLLLQNIEDNHWHDVNAYDKATGMENGMIFFDECGTEGSSVSSTGSEQVQVVKLDDFIQDKITWIKMDIEGAEMDSLHGAQKLIKDNKPKLAVCIYHKCEDLFTIPQYLHDLVPEYKFKIAQHRYDIFDTVLYADVC